MAAPGVVTRPIQLRQAYRAMRKLLADPDNTALVFVVIRSLAGKSYERLYQRVMADPRGRRILDEGRDILPLLHDRDALRSLPEGTLGREYARFLDAEQLSPDGLVEASSEDIPRADYLDPRAEVLGKRLRDTHDLWHVVTGYQRDLFGELFLLAFTYAQTRDHGIAFIVFMACLRRLSERHTDVVGATWRAFRDGCRAESLVMADWERLLGMPLAKVREELRVSPAREYTPLFSLAGAALR